MWSPPFYLFLFFYLYLFIFGKLAPLKYGKLPKTSVMLTCSHFLYAVNGLNQPLLATIISTR